MYTYILREVLASSSIEPMNIAGTSSKPRTTRARKSCGSLSYISYPDLLNSKGDVRARYTRYEKRSAPKTWKAETVILREKITRLGSLASNV